jgi:hypothetical protein
MLSHLGNNLGLLGTSFEYLYKCVELLLKSQNRPLQSDRFLRKVWADPNDLSVGILNPQIKLSGSVINLTLNYPASGNIRLLRSLRLITYSLLPKGVHNDSY